MSDTEPDHASRRPGKTAGGFGAADLSSRNGACGAGRAARTAGGGRHRSSRRRILRCLASVDDPATWCDYATATIAVQRGEADGIAFVLTAADPFVVIELGHCRHPRTGSIDIWAQNFLDVNRHSYVEATPGGDGCVIWGLSAEGTAELNWGFALPIDDKPITVELRRRASRIVAVTGLQLNAVEELAEYRQGRRLGAGVGRPPRGRCRRARRKRKRPRR